tara:strand:+ start:145 stop:360 length:216 start_codon:yes stop_codon:yes gene_type:complete
MIIMANIMGAVSGIMGGIIVGGLIGFSAGWGTAAVGRIMGNSAFEETNPAHVAAQSAVIAGVSLGIIGYSM